MKNRVEVQSYVRFQLSQLGAKNGAHLFERVCFELARLRHVRNILPATGPVQAGGDQGRDFESYRTHLVGAGLGSSTFIAMATDEVVVGAVTLERGDTAGKIRADLKTIFASGDRPDRVIYFCEQDIPVASRHKLQAHCQGAYQAKLDIHDGQAISDQLSDPDTFWIASQFLDIPADLYPKDDVDADYATRRQRWVADREAPENWADFVEIKESLRQVAHEEALLPDLAGWIEVMGGYLEAPSQPLQQKARYEIAIAYLQGHGDLEPARSLVEAYFEDLEASAPRAVDLLDAAVLVLFAWGAVHRGATRLAAETVRGWGSAVDTLVSGALNSTERRGDRCTLLEARASLVGVPPSGQTRDQTLDAVLQAWLRVMAAARDAPFFPVWHIAEFVERTAPALSDRPSYRQLRDEIDDLTRERSGGHAVAEQAERRGIAHYEAGRLLMAVDELQRAKIGWFSGEAMANSLRVMLLLSNCYCDLGLTLAARYYAAGAAYLGLHSEDDEVRAQTPAAVLQLVRMTSAGGEVLSALAMAQQALAVHFMLERRPGEVEDHPLLEDVLGLAAIGYTVVRRLAPELVPLTDAIIDGWPMARQDIDPYLNIIGGPDSPWATLGLDALVDRVEAELGRSPLEDVGPVRRHVWRALGVEWTLVYRNDRETAAAAMGLAATLQIIQADLAQADLLVIPDKVTLSVAVGAVDAIKIDPDGDDAFTWSLVMPEALDLGEVGQRDDYQEVFSIAAALLSDVSALPRQAFMEVLIAAMARDLNLRAYSVRPAREMMAFAGRQVSCTEALAALPTPALPRPILPREAKELAWPASPALGYSVAKARDGLVNRYRFPWRTARPSLERAFADPGVRASVLNMRSDGLKDWQILTAFCGLILTTQIQAAGRLSFDHLGAAFQARSQRAERKEDPVVDATVFTREALKGQLYANNMMVLRNWGLTTHRPDVDPEGVRKLLDVRFNQAVDDIPHEDLFGGPPVEPALLGGEVPSHGNDAGRDRR